MKTKTNSIQTLSVFVAILILFFLSGCGRDNKGGGGVEEQDVDSPDDKIEHPTDITAAEAGAPQFTVDEVFQKQLANVFTAYVELKDAFVESDAKKVQREARDVQDALKKVDMQLVTGVAHKDWMTYRKGMEEALEKIVSSNDIEEQRKHFSTVSGNLYKSIKAYGLGCTTAYYEYCPMAFNDQGGYWLSDNEKIRNPYFGDKMLTCGSVQERLR
jgi:hypothetical protein